MPDKLHRFTSYLRLNPCLTAALLLAIFFSCIGANWGRVECWNLDNMSFRGTETNGLPHNYLKPPLHTYLNHLLVMKPAECVRVMLGAEHNWQYPLQLWGSRAITIALFCGSIGMLYQIALKCCCSRAASIVALLAATSAGLIKFNHFGTADSPLLFWMTASFGFAIRASLSGKALDAAVAGCLAGLAAADKYNGLGVAAAIPAALLITGSWRSLAGKAFWSGAITTPLGFVLGNPGAILDTRNFVQDFLYNLYTTPVYNGQTKGSGYIDFLLAFPELIGWPASVLLLIAMVATLLLLMSGKLRREEMILIASAGAVFFFYFITIGRFPRMADRFVLPVVPFALFLAAPSLGRLPWHRPMPLILITVILAYNVFCSFVLDLRFLSDPRLKAQKFAIREFPANSTIENSYAPSWQLLPGLKVRVHEMPNATGRSEVFSKIFGSNNVITKGIEKFDPANYSKDTFTATGLAKRNPDYVAYSNQVFQFSGDNDAQRFYAALDRGELGYKKIFECVWMPRVPWTYPTEVDFLADRMVILKRDSFSK